MSRRALPIAAGVVAAAVFFVVRSSLTDDTYITLAYARNLASDLHWGLLPGATLCAQRLPGTREPPPPTMPRSTSAAGAGR